MERYSTAEEARAINEIYLDRERRQTGRFTQSSGSSYGPRHTSPGAVAEDLTIQRTRTLPPQNPNGPHAPPNANIHPALRDGVRVRHTSRPHNHCTCWECSHGFLTSTESELAAARGLSVHPSHASIHPQLSGYPQQSGRNDTQGVESRPYSPSASPEPDELEEKEDPIPTGWRMYIHNFTTPWFTINMGTGLLSILLYRVPPPYNAHWLRILGIIVFILNLVLFILFSFIFTLRVLIFPNIAEKIMKCEKESLFLGAWVMGLATLVNMFVFVCVQDGHWGGWPGEYASTAEGSGNGGWAVNFAWAWFWVCYVLSLGVVCLVPFLVMTLHAHDLPTMTGAWLMPILPPIVVSGTGSILASALAPFNPNHALWTMFASYVLLGAGLPLAFSVIAMLFARLTIYTRVPGEEIVSLMIPVGPLGTGGFAIMSLGRVALDTLPRTGSMLGALSGEHLYTFGLICALLMWGYGIFWLSLAVGSMIYQRTFAFNMGWWSLIFPLGVFILSTYTIGNEIPSKFFKIVGIVGLCILTLLWFMDVGNTAYHTYTGKVFKAPWLRKPPKGLQRQARQERKAKRRQEVQG